MAIPAGFKPMLAATFDRDKVKPRHFPCLVSTKIDGVRCVIFGGVAYTRSLKKLPNKFIQKWCQDNATVLEGMDGELVVGPPNAPDTLSVTKKAVLTKDKTPDFRFYVFDLYQPLMARDRTLTLVDIVANGSRIKSVPHNVVVVEQFECHDLEHLNAIEEWATEGEGYEGVMMRDPLGFYKCGRASLTSGESIKVKRFIDEEFLVVDFEELMHNENESRVNELGRTFRSSHKEGKVGGGTLGALVLQVKMLKGQSVHYATFTCGTGFTAEERQQIWDNRDSYRGRWATVKHFPVGVVDLPRHPVFKGFRDIELEGI